MSKSIPQEEAATPEGLKAKYDMCWQKRGSGRSYNSPSGIGSILGQHTGKVMGFKVCSTLCRICDTVSTSRKEPNLHDCPRNWDKSAKAMEADTAARLLKILEETTGLQVDTLIMDDDSSTISKVKQALGHDVEKWSDINHSTKSVSNALYTLQKKHKVFSKDVIGYFKRCFSYAVKQKNKNDKDHLRQNILAIVPHSFGIHENCGAWCRASENHKYKSLPNGKCLSGDDLYKDLSPCGSTKEVESLHNIYGSKAPKRICYSSSEALCIRTSVSVSQKNLGYTYLSEVNTKAGLSPNKVTIKHARELQTERNRQLSYSGKPDVKRRKLDHTLNKTVKQATLEKKEVVVFDLETSSLNDDCCILQIAAKSTKSDFNTYVQPTKPISTATTAVTGLSSGGSILYYNGNPVSASIPEAAFQSFVLWLDTQSPVLLVAHNCKTFDAKRLIFNISQYSCFNAFRECVIGFSDTLPLFKNMYSLDSYTQESLHKHLLENDYIAHNAINDVLSLESIIIKSEVGASLICKYSFTTQSFIKQSNFSLETKKNITTFDNLKIGKFASSGIVHRMAESGLQFSHLMFAYERNGSEGLKSLLLEKRLDEKPRVTKNKSVIDKLLRYFTT
ncbi:Hypothetical predicted protein [Mytilus galloprovincialis]|uniref:Exonuclease domain-containing protein n=1 Tax=Mytilus galloprovincialis TaxID=29158 RepID=A0A8B6CUB8_MYTGA|nr:Hypothetical predicted protein [Mytilus galloprovincialis]